MRVLHLSSFSQLVVACLRERVETFDCFVAFIGQHFHRGSQLLTFARDERIGGDERTRFALLPCPVSRSSRGPEAAGRRPRIA